MDEFINVTKLLKIFESHTRLYDLGMDNTTQTLHTAWSNATAFIQRFPREDVAPVNHSWWKNNGTCANCGGFNEDDDGNIVISDADWCPCCGARMDGGDGHGNEIC